MAKYLVVYKGGMPAEPPTPKAREKSMAAWTKWFTKLGAAVTDMGSATGPAMTMGTDGATKKGASSKLSGYSMVEAKDMAAALKLVKGCPHFKSGGTIEVHETIAM